MFNLNRAVVIYIIGYHGAQIFNKKKIGTRCTKFSLLTKGYVHDTVYTLFVHFMVEKCWQP